MVRRREREVEDAESGLHRKQSDNFRNLHTLLGTAISEQNDEGSNALYINKYLRTVAPLVAWVNKWQTNVRS